NDALLNPCWRLRSSTDTPASASFRIFTIWLSENFDFFMASSPISILPRVVYFSLVRFYGRVTEGLTHRPLPRVQVSLSALPDHRTGSLFFKSCLPSALRNGTKNKRELL